jgi:hypothetical protein
MSTEIDPQDADRWNVQLEDSAPPKKGGVPGWVWGCGGGCLLILGLMTAATLWFFNKVYAMVGPEAAWPEIAEVMPFGPTTEDVKELRPEGYKPFVIPVGQIVGMFGTENVEMDPGDEAFVDSTIVVINRDKDRNSDGKKLMAVLFRSGAGAEGDLLEETLLDDVPESDREEVQIQLQGRTLTAYEFFNRGDDGFSGEGGWAWAVDLSEGRSRPLGFLLQTSGDQRVTQADLDVFLEPFDVWAGN